eukprot:CAMPEP_0172564942 /NCGR_PEP_ID=MMETSP1067-20121228/106295_1 /TAXON_ID=265564 ORGANISM="Thalassiosira punctigera, Strain Tpunct2005C2" /NCGR_SAMPLE_ID=MMETSP1067 /ASSEMBLY_ACC=CAM_ASM_000444 /LENGTH=46 /DNA_ID= /DNA_START= /DNA_END= /DNA_ORIENTATION=
MSKEYTSTSLLYSADNVTSGAMYRREPVWAVSFYVPAFPLLVPTRS